MRKEQTEIENETIELIVSDMNKLSSHQKFSIAQVFDGKSEILLQTLIDDNCTLNIPNANGKLQQVSILAVLLENKSIVGILRDKLIQACEHSQDEEVKIRLAKDPKTPLSIQEKLALDPNGDIRVELVWRDKPEASILKNLAQDENWAVRREVAKSKYATPEILELFINEKDDDVVLEVLQNPNSTTDIINKFAEKFIEQDGWIGENGDKFDTVWNHKFLTLAVEKILDSNEFISDHPLLHYIADHDEEMYRVILAKREDVPVSIYNKLYRESDEIIFPYLALSNLSNEEMLLTMADSKSAQPMLLMSLTDSWYDKVKLHVIKHPNTPEIALKKLSFDKSKEVRKSSKNALSERKQQAKAQNNNTDIESR
ncbi:HEAT repeat domain-containing protein [Sulfurimonas sp. ST-27]|uniref:HEAT repeat domain-containing protein n=1 Tax=Sulfurimonas sp. ST-27 TaxID=3400152 RepID=UPI003AB595D5